MQNLKTGQFFGTTNETIRLNGLTITDTEYTHEKVDWHYHENPYFTFILQGNVIEGNKKETFNCDAGTLLFHNWQEAHYNIKPAGFTRGFHIELEKKWFDAFEIGTEQLQGNINLADPAVKALMYNIFRESKSGDDAGKLAVDSLLIELFGRMAGLQEMLPAKKPAWVNRMKALLHDRDGVLELHSLAHTLNIHPVHLSRGFSKYFNCNLGEYIRNTRLQRALTLLPDARLSLTHIALQCHFADQSHFIRSFKAMYHVTPSQYRNILLKKH
jgi:AraC family transcriptional regulator